MVQKKITILDLTFLYLISLKSLSDALHRLRFLPYQFQKILIQERQFIYAQFLSIKVVVKISLVLRSSCIQWKIQVCTY